jgi:hypothetical protein
LHFADKVRIGRVTAQLSRPPPPLARGTLYLQSVGAGCEWEAHSLSGMHSARLPAAKCGTLYVHLFVCAHSMIPHGSPSDRVRARNCRRLKQFCRKLAAFVCCTHREFFLPPTAKSNLPRKLLNQCAMCRAVLHFCFIALARTQ